MTKAKQRKHGHVVWAYTVLKTHLLYWSNIVCEENRSLHEQYGPRMFTYHTKDAFRCPGMKSAWNNLCCAEYKTFAFDDDVIKWKHIPRYWPFVRGILRSPVNSPHKGQWRGALMCSLICAWLNGWVNNREVGDLRRHRTHCDDIVMFYRFQMVW